MPDPPLDLLLVPVEKTGHPERDASHYWRALSPHGHSKHPLDPHRCYVTSPTDTVWTNLASLEVVAELPLLPWDLFQVDEEPTFESDEED
ncbi:UNVERIFIED_CONTAM: hypothetical protein K2H54_057545 [Gekko kuhli]